MCGVPPLTSETLLSAPRMLLFQLNLYLRVWHSQLSLFITFTKVFKTGIENRKWNYPNKKQNYFSYFQEIRNKELEMRNKKQKIGSIAGLTDTCICTLILQVMYNENSLLFSQMQDIHYFLQEVLLLNRSVQYNQQVMGLKTNLT